MMFVLLTLLFNSLFTPENRGVSISNLRVKNDNQCFVSKFGVKRGYNFQLCRLNGHAKKAFVPSCDFGGTGTLNSRCSKRSTSGRQRVRRCPQKRTTRLAIVSAATSLYGTCYEPKGSITRCRSVRSWSPKM